MIWHLTDDLFVWGEDMDIWNGRLPTSMCHTDCQRYRRWNDSFFPDMSDMNSLICTAVKRFLHLNTSQWTVRMGLCHGLQYKDNQPSSTSTRSSDSIIRALLPLFSLSTRSNSRGGRSPSICRRLADSSRKVQGLPQS